MALVYEKQLCKYESYPVELCTRMLNVSDILGESFQNIHIRKLFGIELGLSTDVDKTA